MVQCVCNELPSSCAESFVTVSSSKKLLVFFVLGQSPKNCGQSAITLSVVAESIQAEDVQYLNGRTYLKEDREEPLRQTSKFSTAAFGCEADCLKVENECKLSLFLPLVKTVGGPEGGSQWAFEWKYANRPRAGLNHNILYLLEHEDRLSERSCRT